MPNIYVGRQPIFDRNLKVYAYELLYRAGKGSTSSAGQISGDHATLTTIINTYVEIGLDSLVGNRYAAINLTEQFLLEEAKLPFPPNQVILEILEDIDITPPLITAVKRLAGSGYTIALDDYLYNPDHEPLLQLADIIKIDIMALDTEGLEEHVRILKKYRAKLLAEKIETPEEFTHCRDLGFDYFQGYFLSRPQLVSGKRLPTNRLAILNLLGVLHDPAAESDDLADAINADVSTSYKLLRLINSVAFNLPRKIESIQHGVLLLGRRKLASWASMLAVSSMDDRPPELLRTAMVRAKMCELLAEQAELKPVESFFTVGLFSSLDLLMQQPLDKLILPLPLSREIVAALLRHTGELGEALDCVLAYEVAEHGKIHFKELSAEQIMLSNIEAVTWANAIVDCLD